jgi:hypothetical protein
MSEFVVRGALFLNGLTIKQSNVRQDAHLTHME